MSVASDVTAALSLWIAVPLFSFNFLIGFAMQASWG